MGPAEANGHLDRCLADDGRREEARRAAAGKPAPGEKDLAPDEEAFIAEFTKVLPPVIARKDIPQHLGGLVSVSTLSHADSAGTGPAGAYRVGAHCVVYRTDQLLRWIVSRFGVRRVININRA